MFADFRGRRFGPSEYAAGVVQYVLFHVFLCVFCMLYDCHVSYVRVSHFRKITTYYLLLYYLLISVTEVESSGIHACTVKHFSTTTYFWR